jgi:hypothetical protein
MNYSQSEDELLLEVQTEYEGIINKLVKELEQEKCVKRKMNDEIRRLSQSLMESEKQIMEKNKKLYKFEMKLLRNSKVVENTSKLNCKLGMLNG